MKRTALFILGLFLTCSVSAKDFDGEKFAKDYYEALINTQMPNAKAEDIEHYLSFLKDDVGNQHIPYQRDDTRTKGAIKRFRKGMTYYLGSHTSYEAKLIETNVGDGFIIIKFYNKASGIHPQTKQVNAYAENVMEVLEIEDNKVARIRRYTY
ncbi:nuclear transport factor 2 family protein [Parashewanella tropica]|uniref:nuclear transport factor 2 family protein n=1 Tax=Parashewanella tropica TaxID=2547970 RepID=UPI00105A8679|nr:nuclear transport factor 2 family protein [Parashewanella tropica]